MKPMMFIVCRKSSVERAFRREVQAKTARYQGNINTKSQCDISLKLGCGLWMPVDSKQGNNKLKYTK
jgi:hypothetical protein